MNERKNKPRGLAGDLPPLQFSCNFAIHWFRYERIFIFWLDKMLGVIHFRATHIRTNVVAKTSVVDSRPIENYAKYDAFIFARYFCHSSIPSHVRFFLSIECSYGAR